MDLGMQTAWGPIAEVLIRAVAFVYAATALWAAAYGLVFFLWLALYMRHRKEVYIAPPVARSDLPSVTVQVPVYNEMDVIEQVIDAVVALVAC